MYAPEHPPTQAVIMAGGKGTRLQPYTYVLPKPLVPLGERPILEFILRKLAAAGLTQVTIALGYKAQILMAVIGDGERFGLNINYYIEEQPLGTMGALALLDNLADNFLVMNGDICTDMDFADFFCSHTASNNELTVASYLREERLELGVLDLDEGKERIIGFREKPTLDLWVSMGIYGLRKSALQHIPQHTFFGFDTLMHTLLGKKQPVGSYPFRGRWHDIGRPDDYALVQDLYAAQGDGIFGLTP